MKFIRHKEIFKIFFLLSWILNFLSLVESRTHFTIVNVTVFLDRRSHGETSTLEHYGVNIDDYSRNTSLTKISLQANVIFLHGLSFEEISRTFCSSVLESNVTVVILQTKNEKLERFVGNLASYFMIPVVSSVSETPLLSDKVRTKET